jgi:hypothetical protein
VNHTKQLRFPNGRTLGRVRQDIKGGEDSFEACVKNGIALPIDYTTEYLNDFERLSMFKDLIEIGDQAKLIPNAGKVTWVIGEPHSQAIKSALSAAMIASKLIKPSQIAIVDFNMDGANRVLGAPRFDDRIKLLAKENSPYLQYAVLLKSKLDKLGSVWLAVDKFLKSEVDRVTFTKLPRRIKEQAKGETLVLSIAPRKVGINDLSMMSSNFRVIIADSRMSSIADLGSSKHFQLNGDRAISSLRKLLAATDKIAEQKTIMGAEGRPIAIRRVTTPSASVLADLKDPKISVRAFIESIIDTRMSWQQVVEEHASHANLTTETYDRLISSGQKWDHKDERAIQTRFDKKQNTVPSLTMG